jgi:hypothetical protein
MRGQPQPPARQHLRLEQVHVLVVHLGKQLALLPGGGPVKQRRGDDEDEQGDDRPAACAEVSHTIERCRDTAIHRRQRRDCDRRDKDHCARRGAILSAADEQP